MPATIEEVGKAKRSEPVFGKFGTPRPAAQGKTPRFIEPIERATPGLRRFKFAVRNHDYRSRMERFSGYVLAKDETEALAFFRKETGVDAVAAKLRIKDKGEPDDPDIAKTELPD